MSSVNHSEVWRVVRNKQSGEFLQIRPTSQPSFLKKKGMYEVVADLSTEADAIQFAQYKALHLTCDAIAYLRHEHNIRNNKAPIDMAYINSLCANTSRPCFGECKSLEHDSSCMLCYQNFPDTWNLCAVVSILREEDRRAKEE